MEEWRAAGLVDNDLRELQQQLLAEPDAGDVIQELAVYESLE